jgi:diguanylate cyclase (GGDEF)-like protein
MQELLALCVRVDELANATYLDMSERCTDADVSKVLGRLAVEEASHVGWWRELLDAWNAGLLPDMWTDSAEALQRLRAIVAELEGNRPGGEALDVETALTTAVRIEFFALDPVFSELLDLAEPAVSRVRQEAYSRHVDRLIEAVEGHFPPDGLPHFLAHVLRRAQRENRVLGDFATRDPLTGLANRRALTTHLDQWTAWAARYGHPVTLLLVDVDRFKTVNDSHGHLTGDSVLRAVGAALAGAVRGADFAARYGGDEFAIIAPELGTSDAEALAVRVLEAVRAIAVTGADGAVVRTTVSIGLGVLNGPADSPPGPADRLLAAADRSLYAAKQAGRDRTGAAVIVGAEGSA